MNLLEYIKRFLFKIKYWIVLIPLVVGVITLFYAMNMPKTYKVRSEIYTGIISSPDPTSEESASANWNLLLNAMDNLMNVIKSPTTLKQVSMRLLSQQLVHGDIHRDTEYISAEKYQELLQNIPQEIQDLVDKDSEENTFNNFLAFQEATNINSFNTILNGAMPYYSVLALSNVEVARIGISDMIELRYECDEPGIAFYTLNFLHQEFVKQYDKLRYEQLQNTIAFFEQEVRERRDSLNMSEANLAAFQKSKGILNFDLQSQSNIALGEALSSRYQETLMAYNSSLAAEKELRNKIDKQGRSTGNLQDFLAEKDAVTNLSYKIARIENLSTSSSTKSKLELAQLKKELEEKKEKLRVISDKVSSGKYSQDGVPITTTLNQWVQESLNIQKAKAEMEVIKERQGIIAQKNQQLLPQGFLLKQRGRDISTDESTYMALINNLNSAKLRLRSLQLSGATMKVITPPNYPTEPVYSKRKATVMFSVIFSVLFVIGYFFIKELFSRKMDNKFRAERLTGQSVLGAFPKIKDNSNKKEYYTQITNKYLSNKLLNFFKSREQNLINILNINDPEGAAFMCDKIQESLSYTGLNIKRLSYKGDYQITSKNFLLANDIIDIYMGNEDIIITELPSADDVSIPEGLLNKAAINLLVVNAEESWKDNYQALLKSLIEKKGGAPFYLYLYNSDIDTLKEFTEV